jgi:hypothetical protein
VGYLGHYPLAGMILASSMFALSRSGVEDAVEENLGDFSGARGMSTPLPVRLLSMQGEGICGLVSHSFHPVALKSFLESSTRAYDHRRRSGPLPGARHVFVSGRSGCAGHSIL